MIARLKKISLSETQILWMIFLTFLAVRILYVLLSGHDSFELQPDTYRYDRQSNAILGGDYNLLEPLFITAPFYPYFEAFFKLVFSSHWILALQTAQILLTSLSGVFLYKIAKIIWHRRDVSLVAAGFYCFYPFTFWWVHTFAQDMPFQYQLIFSVYFLLKSVYKNHFPSLIICAVLFSITFLTKSHILLFAPFIALFIFLARNQTVGRKFLYVAAFTAICLTFTLPYGLYNLKANGVYVISSTGQGGFFLTGHNDDIYKAVVSPPPQKSPEAQRLANLEYDVFRELESRKQGMTHAEVQKMYFDAGVKWCLENPRKVVVLSFYDLYYFLMPGLNPNWYSSTQWLLSLLISAPLYLPAYFAIGWSCVKDFRKHFWIFGLFLSMVVFSVGFYVQNRFRTITIEPFYLLYAALPAADLFYILSAKMNLFKTNKVQTDLPVSNV